jgi:uncharacterized protein YqjF (DUF2071 family)
MTAETRQVFLTAVWRYLAMLTFEVEPDLLQPFVPRGTELDLHENRALITLVGFRFLHTRILGFRIPFHQHFDEVNLRFYVRRDARGETRRGVTFIREIVPRRLIAFVARVSYNEPYVALPMKSDVPVAYDGAPPRVQYAWRPAGAWHHIAVAATGAPALLGGHGEAAFVTEHRWGYSRRRDGGTHEYRVDHPPWRVWTDVQSEISGAMGMLYGPALGEALAGVPTSALVAEGSEVTIFRPTLLTNGEHGPSVC